MYEMQQLPRKMRGRPHRGSPGPSRRESTAHHPKPKRFQGITRSVSQGLALHSLLRTKTDRHPLTLRLRPLFLEKTKSPSPSPAHAPTRATSSSSATIYQKRKEANSQHIGTPPRSPQQETLTGILGISLVVPPMSRPGVAAAFVTSLRDVPDLFEDLDTKALVVGIVAGEVAVVLALGVGAGAAKDELFPVAHSGLFGMCRAGGNGTVGVSVSRHQAS